MSKSPAGWYLQDDGRQRYWDGARWTEHFAPGTGLDAAGSEPESLGATGQAGTVATATLPAVVPTRADAPSGMPLAPPGTVARPWFRRKLAVIPAGLAAFVLAVAVTNAVTDGDRAPEPARAAAPPSAAAAPTPAPSASASLAAATDQSAAQAPVAAASTAPDPAPAPRIVSFDGDGTYEVGEDIQPGLYRSSGNGYWERLKDASGDFDAIIANDNTAGQTYVQIKKSDGYFSTSNMDDWVLVDPSAEGPLATSFSGDGMYMIGVDIKPGTYKSSGDGYWERLKGASGGFDPIIANDNVANQAIVQIRKTDKFFSTSDMGQWTRVK